MTCGELGSRAWAARPAARPGVPPRRGTATHSGHPTQVGRGDARRWLRGPRRGRAGRGRRVRARVTRTDRGSAAGPGWARETGPRPATGCPGRPTAAAPASARRSGWSTGASDGLGAAVAAEGSGVGSAPATDGTTGRERRQDAEHRPGTLRRPVRRGGWWPAFMTVARPCASGWSCIAMRIRRAPVRGASGRSGGSPSGCRIGVLLAAPGDPGSARRLDVVVGGQFPGVGSGPT